MSNTDLAKISQTAGLGKSTLITTTVSIPMPSGAKQPASQGGKTGASSPSAAASTTQVAVSPAPPAPQKS